MVAGEPVAAFHFHGVDVAGAADLLVRDAHEPFGIAPLEAMASGLPLVAPDAGGIKSYASRENAFLVEITAPAFAAAVRHAMHSAEERRRLAANALETALRFSWTASTDQYLELYRSICAVHAGRMQLGDAAPAFRSTAAAAHHAARQTWVARQAQAGFRLYGRIAGLRNRASKSKQWEGAHVEP